MAIIQQHAPRTQIYSIDEAFIDMSGVKKPLAFSRTLRTKIMRWTGIPVSIGIGPTKTLAKLANEYVKHTRLPAGVAQLADTPNTPDTKTGLLFTDKALVETPVQDVWGVGYQYAKLLNAHGIHTAFDLKNTSDKWIKRRASVSLQKTVWELRGTACFRLEERPADQKSVTCARTFSRAVESKQYLTRAISGHVEKVAEKLRQQQLVTKDIQVYICTNRHNKSDRQYSAHQTIQLPVATSYTPILIQAAHQALVEIYSAQYRYKYSSITCHTLLPETEVQLNLLEKSTDTHKQAALMHAVDLTNQKWGKHTIGFGGNYRTDTALHGQSNCSPAYTTDWNDIPTITRCG